MSIRHLEPDLHRESRRHRRPQYDAGAVASSSLEDTLSVISQSIGSRCLTKHLITHLHFYRCRSGHVESTISFSIYCITSPVEMQDLTLSDRV